MKKLALLSVLGAALAALPFILQGAAAAAAAPAAVSSTSPVGWKLRIDASTDATDPDGAGPVKFTKEGAGFHAVNPAAAVYWNPASTATGNFTVKAKFTQLEVSNHENFFGLVIGGTNLDNAQQKYVYFMVSQNGNFLVKSRNGDVAGRAPVPTVVAKTPNAVIVKPDASGKSVNELEIRVLADKIDYVVNGTVVTSTPKTGLTAQTNGIYGLRVNHFLNVQIDNLTMTPAR